MVNSSLPASISHAVRGHVIIVKVCYVNKMLLLLFCCCCCYFVVVVVVVLLLLLLL